MTDLTMFYSYGASEASDSYEISVAFSVDVLFSVSAAYVAFAALQMPFS